ncbi:MAG: peptidylprolyl isomerase [Sulfuricaulis sp.]|uniref:peptidylprolyl isomerase n=1 Tax=Sulfuricaulis sp. TaxID=2003553 RepID=UPI003C468E9D
MTIVRAISRIVSYCRYYHRGQAFLRFAAGAVLAGMLFLPQLAAATTVRMITTLGTIDIELYDDQAPITVANFLRYAGRGDYSTNGIIYRSAPGFVIQGGGYAYQDIPSPFGLYRYFFHIPTDPPVQNEFSPSRSNLRGTIAMAKLPGNPDSATSDWFINLADNSANLDYQNGGFTVFGQVLNPGMNIVDAISILPRLDASNASVTCSIPLCNLPISAFNTLPVINYNSATGLDPSNLVMVTSIPNVTATKTSYGTTSAYAADVDMTLLNPNSNRTVDTATSTSWLATFTPPFGKTVQFNDEISRFTMSGAMGPAGRVVTLYHGINASVNRYYAYGPTPDNATPHWYDFTFDGTTGAEIVGNKILLHFVDGQRGDDDLTVNNSITHTGAPVLETDITTSSSSSSNSYGCSIAARPSQSAGNGDWVLVSLFLAFVALVRRHTRR